MPSKRIETEKKVAESLLIFIGFLYVVVFGLIIAGIFRDVLMPEDKPFSEKAVAILMVLAAFYFLVWDWLHGRLLTLKNHYSRYSRFFLEALIAACAYGVAFAALRGSIFILQFIALVLLLGSAWATITLREYPKSRDKRELKVIQEDQLYWGIVSEGFFIFCYFAVGTEINIVIAITIVVFGWLFVFFYERQIKRQKGLLGGPGVPFLKREIMEKIRQKFRKKKGHQNEN